MKIYWGQELREIPKDYTRQQAQELLAADLIFFGTGTAKFLLRSGVTPSLIDAFFKEIGSA